MATQEQKNVFAKNIKYYLDKKNLTQTEFAKLLNYPEMTVSNWVNAKFYPRIDKIQEMADFLSINKSDLIEDKQKPIDYTNIANLIPLEKAVYIPILGDIACGSPIWAEENYSGSILIDNNIIKADFVLKTKGDSMIDVGIHEGDYVFLRKTSTVEDGKIAAVLIDNEATLKRVHFFDDMLVLEACNQNYTPIIIKKEDNKDLLILGELVGVYSDKSR